jgi:hypothetical protein
MGAFYIHGREKNYRPIVIIDAPKLTEMLIADKNSVTPEVCIELWGFLCTYIRKVMFLPGQADQCLNIVNLGNMGLTDIPRSLILTFFDVLQRNMMYFMAKSFYLNLSWI